MGNIVYNRPTRAPGRAVGMRASSQEGIMQSRGNIAYNRGTRAMGNIAYNRSTRAMGRAVGLRTRTESNRDRSRIGDLTYSRATETMRNAGIMRPEYSSTVYNRDAQRAGNIAFNRGTRSVPRAVDMRAQEPFVQSRGSTAYHRDGQHTSHFDFNFNTRPTGLARARTQGAFLPSRGDAPYNRDAQNVGKMAFNSGSQAIDRTSDLGIKTQASLMQRSSDTTRNCDTQRVFNPRTETMHKMVDFRSNRIQKAFPQRVDSKGYNTRSVRPMNFEVDLTTDRQNKSQSDHLTSMMRSKQKVDYMCDMNSMDGKTVEGIISQAPLMQRRCNMDYKRY